MSNTDLIDVLRQSSNEDLEPLVEFLKKPITKSISTYKGYQKYYPDHGNYLEDIAHCIRWKGGNTIANISRKEGPEYAKIVQKVANKLKADCEDGDSVEEIERKIVTKILEKVYEKMDSAERKELMEAFEKAGISADWTSGFPVAVILMQAGVRIFFAYRTVAMTTITRTLGLFTGPLGWIIAGLLTAISLSRPAYRVRIPCVCYVAYLRQKIKSQNDFGKR